MSQSSTRISRKRPEGSPKKHCDELRKPQLKVQAKSNGIFYLNSQAHAASATFYIKQEVCCCDVETSLQVSYVRVLVEAPANIVLSANSVLSRYYQQPYCHKSIHCSATTLVGSYLLINLLRVIFVYSQE